MNAEDGSIQRYFEGDGIYELLNFYELLWKKSKDLKSCDTRIPDTIIYKRDFPVDFFFYDTKLNDISKKSSTDIDSNKILENFQMKMRNRNHGSKTGKKKKGKNNIRSEYSQNSGGVQCDICCYYMSSYKNVNTVEYFSLDELEDFLFKRERKGDGILQQFIPPKGNHNDQIRIVWTPTFVKVNRRENIHKLENVVLNSRPLKNVGRLSNSERAVTFDGNPVHSKDVLVTKLIEKELKKQCIRIVEHVSEVAKQRIVRMVVFFKIDRGREIWTLFPSSIRCEKKRTFHNPKERLKLPPLNLQQQFVTVNRSTFSIPQTRKKNRKKKKKKKKKSSERISKSSGFPRTPESLHFSAQEEEELPVDGNLEKMGDLLSKPQTPDNQDNFDYTLTPMSKNKFSPSKFEEESMDGKPKVEEDEYSEEFESEESEEEDCHDIEILFCKCCGKATQDKLVFPSSFAYKVLKQSTKLQNIDRRRKHRARKLTRKHVPLQTPTISKELNDEEKHLLLEEHQIGPPITRLSSKTTPSTKVGRPPKPSSSAKKRKKKRRFTTSLGGDLFMSIKSPVLTNPVITFDPTTIEPPTPQLETPTPNYGNFSALMKNRKVDRCKTPPSGLSSNPDLEKFLELSPLTKSFLCKFRKNPHNSVLEVKAVLHVMYEILNDILYFMKDHFMNQRSRDAFEFDAPSFFSEIKNSNEEDLKESNEEQTTPCDNCECEKEEKEEKEDFGEDESVAGDDIFDVELDGDGDGDVDVSSMDEKEALGYLQKKIVGEMRKMGVEYDCTTQIFRIRNFMAFETVKRKFCELKSRISLKYGVREPLSFKDKQSEEYSKKNQMIDALLRDSEEHVEEKYPDEFKIAKELFTLSESSKKKGKRKKMVVKGGELGFRKEFGGTTGQRRKFKRHLNEDLVVSKNMKKRKASKRKRKKRRRKRERECYPGNNNIKEKMNVQSLNANEGENGEDKFIYESLSDSLESFDEISEEDADADGEIQDKNEEKQMTKECKKQKRKNKGKRKNKNSKKKKKLLLSSSLGRTVNLCFNCALDLTNAEHKRSINMKRSSVHISQKAYRQLTKRRPIRRASEPFAAIYKKPKRFVIVQPRKKSITKNFIEMNKHVSHTTLPKLKLNSHQSTYKDDRGNKNGQISNAGQKIPMEPVSEVSIKIKEKKKKRRKRRKKKRKKRKRVEGSDLLMDFHKTLPKFTVIRN